MYRYVREATEVLAALHKRHGMNVQVIACPFGRLPWASSTLPGAVHGIKAARTHAIVEALTEASVRTWADKGLPGSSGHDPRALPGPLEDAFSRRARGELPRAKLRPVGEQANATLKGSRLLRKLRCSTTRIANIVKAVLALHLAASA